MMVDKLYGSSIVIICPLLLRLRWSIIDANEVDLPAPAAPENDSPRFFIAKRLSTWVSPSYQVGIVDPIRRSTIPAKLR